MQLDLAVQGHLEQLLVGTRRLGLAAPHRLGPRLAPVLPRRPLVLALERQSPLVRRRPLLVHLVAGSSEPRLPREQAERSIPRRPMPRLV